MYYCESQMYFLKPKRIFDNFNLLPYFKDKYNIAYDDKHYLFFPKSGESIEKYEEDFNKTYAKALSENMSISFNLRANDKSIKTCRYHYDSIIEDYRDKGTLKAYEYMCDNFKEDTFDWKKMNNKIKDAVYNLEEISKLEGVCKDHLIISHNR